MTDILNSNTLVTLKKICKFLHIKNYSGLRKNELILAINKYHAIIKLQRWTRKILTKNEQCSISCEPIRYPCFAFKTSNNVLIYYNLEALRAFLIKTGDFRDPNTRTLYTDKQLLDIDSIYKYYTSLQRDKQNKEDSSKIKRSDDIASIDSVMSTVSVVNSQSDNITKPVKKIKINKTNENVIGDEYFKSVFKASKSTKFYEKLKEKEQEQLIFERILDSICDEIITFINENEKDNFFALNGIYLHDYQTQFRRLINRSKKHAEYVINKHIENINQLTMKERSYNNNQRKSCEYVVIYLYQLREEIYLE